LVIRLPLNFLLVVITRPSDGGTVAETVIALAALGPRKLVLISWNAVTVQQVIGKIKTKHRSTPCLLYPMQPLQSDIRPQSRC
jgi:hypothetical protein